MKVDFLKQWLGSQNHIFRILEKFVNKNEIRSKQLSICKIAQVGWDPSLSTRKFDLQYFLLRWNFVLWHEDFIDFVSILNWYVTPPPHKVKVMGGGGNVPFSENPKNRTFVPFSGFWERGG